VEVAVGSRADHGTVVLEGTAAVGGGLAGCRDTSDQMSISFNFIVLCSLSFPITRFNFVITFFPAIDLDQKKKLLVSFPYCT
jgi:hypothetical protein